MAIAPKSFLYASNADTGVVTLALNRPERLNALTFDVYAELRDTFHALDTEPGVRAIEAEFDLSLDEALRHEAEVQAGLMEHPNFREAYEAFRAKREPKFR